MAERSELMGIVFGEQSRQALADMLSTREEEHKDEKVYTVFKLCYLP